LKKKSKKAEEKISKPLLNKKIMNVKENVTEKEIGKEIEKKTEIEIEGIVFFNVNINMN